MRRLKQLNNIWLFIDNSASICCAVSNFKIILKWCALVNRICRQIVDRWLHSCIFALQYQTDSYTCLCDCGMIFRAPFASKQVQRNSARTLYTHTDTLTHSWCKTHNVTYPSHVDNLEMLPSRTLYYTYPKCTPGHTNFHLCCRDLRKGFSKSSVWMVFSVAVSMSSLQPGN